MPLYIYFSKKLNKTVEIVQSMNEPHIYSEGKEIFDRVFQVPQANTDTKLDPFKVSDFIKKTNQKSDNIGSLYDRSKEAALKRSDLAGGVDPIAVNFRKEYSKKRAGRALPVKNGNQYFSDRM